MSRVTLGDRNFEDLLTIATRLRAADREEVFATHFTDDPAALAVQTFNAGAFQWIAYRDGEPIASIGAAPLWPGVWSVWAFGTERWPDVALTLTKHVRRFMLPALVNFGAHRALCYALASHAQARRWLERLGAEPKCELDGWGKNGEDFVLYWWRRDRTNRTDANDVFLPEG